MRPSEAEVLHLHIIGRALVAIDGCEETQIEIAGELVSLDIGRSCIDTPRAFGVDFAGEREVHVVVDCKIVTAVAQVEAAVVILAHGGHDDTALVFAAEREVAKRHRDGERHIGEHHIHRTGDDILLWLHLSLCDLEIEVGMLVVVAGGVAAILDVIFIVGHLLGETAGEISLALLGDNILDKTLLRLEIVGHLLRLVFTARVVEHRGSHHLAGAIGAPDCIHDTGAHIHLNLVGREIDVAIFHHAAAIHERSVFADENQRVFGSEIDRVVEIDLFLDKTGLASRGVDCR